MIFRGCTPLGWEGTFASWIAALERILALAPAVIVPGHGPLCGPEGAQELIDYFRYVHGEARRCFERGLSLEDAAAAIELGPYGRGTSPSAWSSTWRARTASSRAARPTNRCPPPSCSTSR